MKEYTPSEMMNRLKPLLLEDIEVKRKNLSGIEAVRALQLALLDALIPACEALDRMIQINPSYIKYQQSEKSEDYQHDVSVLLKSTQNMVWDLVNKVEKNSVSDKNDLPKMRVSEEKKDPDFYVYDDAKELRKTQANATLVLAAIAQQLGIENQFVTYYKQHSPLFTHPHNVALLNKATGSLPEH